jgi:hypothetical protein
MHGAARLLSDGPGNAPMTGDVGDKFGDTFSDTGDKPLLLFGDVGDNPVRRGVPTSPSRNVTKLEAGRKRRVQLRTPKTALNVTEDHQDTRYRSTMGHPSRPSMTLPDLERVTQDHEVEEMRSGQMRRPARTFGKYLTSRWPAPARPPPPPIYLIPVSHNRKPSICHISGRHNPWSSP